MDSLRFAARVAASDYVLRAHAQQHEKPTTVRFSLGYCTCMRCGQRLGHKSDTGFNAEREKVKRRTDGRYKTEWFPVTLVRNAAKHGQPGSRHSRKDETSSVPRDGPFIYC